MIRIDLVAPPMAGHLHPVIGLAQRLAADHAVRVLTTAAGVPDVRAAGVRAVAVLPGADAEIRRITRPDRPVRADPRRLLGQFRAAMALQARFAAELRSCWSSDPPALVLADYTVPAAGPAARQAGARWWTTHPSPCVIETPDGPPAYLGGWAPARGPLGAARDATGRVLIHGFKRAAHRSQRAALQALGFPAAYRRDGTEAAYSPERVLALFPEELEFDATRPPAVRYVGPVLFSLARPGPPPPLRPDRPAVLLTLGTEQARLAPRLVGAAHRLAAARPDLDVHISLGGAPEPPGLRGDAIVLPWIDYARHLSRYTLVAHHGGAGVLSHTVAAGLPAVVCPIDYDQFDHATRLVCAGVALRCRTPQALPEVVNEALHAPGLRSAARRLAAQLRSRPSAEDQVAALVAAPADAALS